MKRGQTDTLTRARRSTFAFAVAVQGVCLIQQDRSLPVERVVAGHVAITLLLLSTVTVYKIKRPLWGEPVLVLPLVLTGGQGLLVQPAAVALCLSVLAAQSLYGGQRAALVRTVAVAASPLAFVSLSLLFPRDEAIALEQFIVPVPLLLIFGLFLRTLYSALLQEQRANQREALLAETSRALLGQTDLSVVRDVEKRTATAACSLHPGLGIDLLQRRPDGALEPVWSAGSSEPAGGTVAAASFVPEASRLTPLPAAQRAGSGTPGRRERTASVLGLGSDREQLLLVTHTGALPAGFGEMIETLAAQFVMAETNCRSHAELVSLAHHDSLTQIANRAAFLAALDRTVAEAVGHEPMLSLLVIDLDDFKVINDSLGHAAGDAILVASADRMTEIAGEHGLAARFGGDEFAVLLTGVRDPAETSRLAETLLHQLIQPVRWEDEELRVGASIGVVTGAPGLNGVDLMRCADIAMYSAKALGKNRVVAFTDTEHGSIATTRQLEDQLTRSTLPQDVVLHYEPVVDLHTGACSALRAEARWEHPTMGTLLPGTVIPLAERTGVITDLDRTVLEKACGDAVGWLRNGQPAVDLIVAVSSQLAGSGELAAAVSAALNASGLAPEHLTLEVDEKALLQGSELTREFRALEQLGVATALSGFGGRAASLGTLELLHLRRIVVDAARLRPSEPESHEFVALVTAIAGVLGITVDAGAVRSHDLALWIAEHGVDRASGHHFAHPMTIDHVRHWLRPAGDLTAHPIRP